MLRINRDKFKRNKELGLKLLATQSRQLINGYGGGGQAQAFWGMLQLNSTFQGLNTLGKVLMQIREQIKNNNDHAQWVDDQNP